MANSVSLFEQLAPFHDETHAGLPDADSGGRVSTRAISDLVEAVRTGFELLT